MWASLQRVYSVARKETLHILRDRVTLVAVFAMPIMQMCLLGFAINTNVRDIRTVVYDQAGTQESRLLLQKFENTDDFEFVGLVYTEEELTQALVKGKAKVGIKIPENFSRQLAAGEQAQVLVLVDGSDSSVAGEAVNVSANLALNESLARVLDGKQLPIEVRPRVMFNPNMRSANYFIPGLMIVLTQILVTMMAANAIVREKETGTLEQFFMTPVKPGELIVGKMLPYLLFGGIVFCFITLLMRTVFAVPINGYFPTLLGLVVPFILASLAIGLWVSTKVDTKEAANHLGTATYLPSIFLSGYVFPTDSMPEFFQYVSMMIPTTWMVDASRGVILRGATWSDLSTHSLVLWGMAIVMLVFTSARYRKRLS